MQGSLKALPVVNRVRAESVSISEIYWEPSFQCSLTFLMSLLITNDLFEVNESNYYQHLCAKQRPHMRLVEGSILVPYSCKATVKS